MMFNGKKTILVEFVSNLQQLVVMCKVKLHKVKGLKNKWPKTKG